MLQNPCKTLGFKKNMVYKILPGGGGGKPYPASGLQKTGFLTLRHILDGFIPKMKNTEDPDWPALFEGI